MVRVGLPNGFGGRSAVSGGVVVSSCNSWRASGGVLVVSWSCFSRSVPARWSRGGSTAYAVGVFPADLVFSALLEMVLVTDLVCWWSVDVMVAVFAGNAKLVVVDASLQRIWRLVLVFRTPAVTMVCTVF
jgi:hypothetical protein